jgi:hypothetical protein
VKERDLREAEARARQQQQLTESELNITVETNQGKAEFQRSLQEANRIRALAEAEAGKVRTMAEAEAERAARIVSPRRLPLRNRSARTAALNISSRSR